jgi:hypothetical protein
MQNRNNKCTRHQYVSTVTTNNTNLYFGYNQDQNSTITVAASGGTAPIQINNYFNEAAIKMQPGK